MFNKQHVELIAARHHGEQDFHRINWNQIS